MSTNETRALEQPTDTKSRRSVMKPLRENMVERLYREALERAKKGEPEPGNHHCARCDRGPAEGVVAHLVFTKSGKRESQGELNAMDQYMRNRIGDDLRLELFCPCCSSPGGCEHTPIKCSVCGLLTNPAGTFAGGGPFVRCDGPESHRLSPLTWRETLVAKVVAEGLSNKEVAKRLNISPSTVKQHLSNALEKLGLENRTQLALWWQRHNSPSPEQAAG